ncbi:hypothetical protein [Nocardia sp. NPDC057030]|uniref:hypothetical protein n=1 Tax=Nocardia sp. NPDC057030 TaxID=3346005 RepID=UPI00363D61F8
MTIRVLAHEVNHAHPSGYHPREVPFDGLTKNEWVVEKIFESFRSEGDADIAARNCRRRILAKGGPDIGISTDDASVNAIYEDYISKKITREEARWEIGYIYGTAKVTNGVDDRTFTLGDIYGREYAAEWDDFFGKG